MKVVKRSWLEKDQNDEECHAYRKRKRKADVSPLMDEEGRIDCSWSLFVFTETTLAHLFANESHQEGFVSTDDILSALI